MPKIGRGPQKRAERLSGGAPKRCYGKLVLEGASCRFAKMSMSGSIP